MGSGVGSSRSSAASREKLGRGPRAEGGVSSEKLGRGPRWGGGASFGNSGLASEPSGKLGSAARSGEPHPFFSSSSASRAVAYRAE